MKEIHASIITIGDELLIGQTIDTNSAFIAQQLNSIGIWVKHRLAVGDVREDIIEALQREKETAQLIIITGGLGPTADDITKPVLCDYFDCKMVRNQEIVQHVTKFFEKLNRPVTERNLSQADLPDNCVILKNEKGTAPGMWFEKEGVVYISLPGVPIEMRSLIENTVIPKLKAAFTLPTIVHKTAITMGQGESFLADALVDFEKALPPYIKLAYLPHYRLVKLRLTAKGFEKEVLEKEVSEHFKKLTGLVNEWLVAEEDSTIVEALGKIVGEKGKYIASAESCTGGYIAHLLTSRSGSSSTFKGSVVSYSNEAKENPLGVKHETLVTFGAVSEETVIEMVKGVRQLMNVDYSVATSGIMGPDGGTREKPVGTVWIAVCNKDRVVTQKHFVHMDRQRNIEMTALIALNMLRKFVLEEEEKANG